MGIFRRKNADVKKATAKAENPYVQTSRNEQNSYAPFYLDNINYQQGFNLVKGQQTGLGVANETILGHSIVSAIVDGAIGQGLSCESAVNEDFLGESTDHETVMRVQKALEAWFSIWSSDAKYCDRYGMGNLPALERQALTMLVEHGEFFALIRVHRIGDYFFPQVELISPLMVSSPMLTDTDTIIQGIEYNDRKEEVAYWVKKITSTTMMASDWVKIPKRSRSGRIQMLHVRSDVIQPNQARGTSVLMPLANNLVQIDRFNEANAVKSVIQASIGFAIETDKDVIEDETSNEVFEEIYNASKEIMENVPVKPETPNQTVPMKAGVALNLPSGKHMKMVESNAPTVNYWDFINGNLKMMCGGKIPAPEKIFKSYLASYSASQASMQESQRVFELWVSLLSDGFLNELYRQFVRCLVVQNLVEIPNFFASPFAQSAWSTCQWYCPALVHNDPVKAVKASVMKINAGLSTREIETRNLIGKPWSRIISQSAEEQNLIKELGIQISDSDKAEVWEDEPEEESEENGK